MPEDEQPTAKSDETVKTALDLKVEALEKELADLKTRYDSDIAEYQRANRELWAELHPVREEPPPAPAQEQPALDEAEASFYKTLGITKEN